VRELVAEDGMWRGLVCQECKGLNPEWYDARYHELPECEGRYHEGHRDGCSLTAPLSAQPSQPEER
jgi:hypothetical protein